MPRKRPVSSTRPAHHPALADYFVALRNREGWSQLQAADIASRQRLSVSINQLRGLETGTTKEPEADLLLAISRLYGVAYEDVVAQVLAANVARLKEIYPIDASCAATPPIETGQKSAQQIPHLTGSAQDATGPTTAKDLPQSKSDAVPLDGDHRSVSEAASFAAHALAALEKAREAYLAAAVDTRALAKTLGQYIARIAPSKARKRAAAPRRGQPRESGGAARHRR